MYHTDSKREMYAILMRILWPILITQILLYSMNMIDTMMSGRASVDDLAGVAIGSSFWAPVSTGINGILLAVTAIVANLIGADEKEKVHNTVMQAMYIAVGIAVIVLFSGLFFLDDLLRVMDPQVLSRYFCSAYCEISLMRRGLQKYRYTLFPCRCRSMSSSIIP